MGCDQVTSTVVNWRRWALYGGLIAAAYTGLETYPDLATKSFALYSGKLIGSTIAGVILGGVAALVRNRYARRNADGASSDSSA